MRTKQTTAIRATSNAGDNSVEGKVLGQRESKYADCFQKNLYSDIPRVQMGGHHTFNKQNNAGLDTDTLCACHSLELVTSHRIWECIPINTL